MRIEEGLHLVMSGGGGFDLTDAFDCNVFLVGAEDGWLMFDAGAGRDPDLVFDVLAGDGIDPASIRHLLLTHGHADHSGGAAALRERLGLAVHAGAATAAMVAKGDEEGISLGKAKRGGVYPPDYAYRACPVDGVWQADEVRHFGDVSVQLIETPGHSRDHVSYLVTTPRRKMLVAGDALFHGGKVAIQDISDCDVGAICETVRRLATVEFDTLLP
ncbi:MBL fold metallo-hydrolase [Kaistia sp. MMO-174]|uniref:MBL fold metallo-hydrolase n=1 Tax=Kaistia sp. MMO-174 TaxID=3081256 RepID=UPI0030194502